jgi:pimeloyl-ACP methyl ester carboxylesterase
LPFLKVGNQRLEYDWFGPSSRDAATLVFLHEGLGCVATWRDFPRRLGEATGCGALVYSRAGYGNSDPVKLPRSVRFMHDEALMVLPEVLEVLDVRDAILFGHSDGGSIALIHAGGGNAKRVRGLILEAPHVFVEDFGLASIRAIASDYENGTLKANLERYHGSNVDCAFRGWNEMWLNPEFRSWNIQTFLPLIKVPVLVIQGKNDQYGTFHQVEAIEKGCSGPVHTVLLEQCGHSPHRDQPQRTLASAISFLKEELITT